MPHILLMIQSAKGLSWSELMMKKTQLVKELNWSDDYGILIAMNETWQMGKYDKNTEVA